MLLNPSQAAVIEALCTKINNTKDDVDVCLHFLKDEHPMYARALQAVKATLDGAFFIVWKILLDEQDIIHMMEDEDASD